LIHSYPLLHAAAGCWKSSRGAHHLGPLHAAKEVYMIPDACVLGTLPGCPSIPEPAALSDASRCPHSTGGLVPAAVHTQLPPTLLPSTRHLPTWAHTHPTHAQRTCCRSTYMPNQGAGWHHLPCTTAHLHIPAASTDAHTSHTRPNAGLPATCRAQAPGTAVPARWHGGTAQHLGARLKQHRLPRLMTHGAPHAPLQRTSQPLPKAMPPPSAHTQPRTGPPDRQHHTPTLLAPKPGA
jgi:hypothetical protein